MNSKFEGLMIASIQAGHRIAMVEEIIIDPHKLRIPALFVTKAEEQEQLILHTEDISEVTARGLVIDHNDLLMSNDGELVRLQKIIDLDFDLLNKLVETESGLKVGTVSRFAVDTKTFTIVQIYVNQPVTLNLSKAEVIVHRKQIVNVTQKKIVVKDTSVKTGAKFSIRGLLFGKQPTTSSEPESTKRSKV